MAGESGADFEAHYQNFTSGLEWRLVQKGHTRTCSLYGLDEWNDYCYGASQNEVFAANIDLAGQTVSMFEVSRRSSSESALELAQRPASAERAC